MTKSETSPILSRQSLLCGFLSLMVPGLGQVVAKGYRRGITIFLGILTLGGLTVWTAAQRARFPDYTLSLRVFLGLLAESAALWVFLLALYSLFRRYLLKEGFTRRASNGVFAVVAFLTFSLVFDLLLDSVLPQVKESQIHGLTAVFGATTLAALWLWNIRDAAQARPGAYPSMTPFIMLSVISVLALGTRITQIDLPKAIREYRDTESILRRIVWPWRAAFDYQINELRAKAKIVSPCPEGSPPEPNARAGQGPWIVVTPTCGEQSQRDSKGKVTFGTLLTIEGGGFNPGTVAHLEWENTIGNTFTPRGLGEAEFQVEADGTFTTALYIPDGIVTSSAEGSQPHHVHVFQRGTEKFTPVLSREMKLGLQGMLETIMMGMMATFSGIALSIPVSFLAARNLMRPIRISLQGFVGGVIGLILGGWAGMTLAGSLASLIGGLEQAPVLTALLYLLLIAGMAIVGFRVLGKILDLLGSRLPTWGAQVVSAVGLAVIGGAGGYVLGLAYARGILGITMGVEAAAQAAPSTGRLSALLFAVMLGAVAFRFGPRGQFAAGQMTYFLVRTLLNIVRSIEPLIWAVVGIIWIGPGPFAGFIALTIHSVAALGKLYSEAIESIRPGPIEALQATGANRLQTIMYAVVPQVLPPFIAFTIYRWDINVRMSTIIGLVGGGGIGFLLIQWIRQFQYQSAGIAVWLITITVAALDFISGSIRERYV